MSDFIYSREIIENGKMLKEIQKIYHEDKPSVEEFHGEWGSLAVSSNLYNGFQPYETKDYIFVVIGGPVLCFQNNEFIKMDSGNTGSKVIFNLWIQDKIRWDEDLSGPFAIIIINKNTSEVQCVTDLMSFIPVYIYQDSTNSMLSTHVDVLAKVSNQKENIDVVSYANFILHSVVTFPFTVYSEIFQINPASVYQINGISSIVESNPYWIPKEIFNYRSINKAAEDLRQGLENYVNTISKESSNIAQFISGGEDSRTLSALLQGYSRNAFIFLDYMNREGRMAKKAAKAYGADFKIETRSTLHYLEILSSCSDLVGSGSQYKHAHTFGFHKSCRLNEYDTVFGGLFSDALLKGARIKKIRGLGRFPFLPDIKSPTYSAGDNLKNKAFSSEVLEELTKRRQKHLKYVQSFRGDSAEEWFELWPSSMNKNIPNIHANRRLFRSYEPFMANDIVKLSASVPQKWKLNRRLFNKAAKPLLKPTKWLLHSDGRLPYYPWYINFFVQFIFWVYQSFGRKTGLIKGNQGPWGEWNKIMKSNEWKKVIDKYSLVICENTRDVKEKELIKLFEKESLNDMQRINLLQTIYEINKKYQ